VLQFAWQTPKILVLALTGGGFTPPPTAPPPLAPPPMAPAPTTLSEL